ncbi:MAG: DPP IV N-terminal domain-containing protein [Myxococcota bacterium]
MTRTPFFLCAVWIIGCSGDDGARGIDGERGLAGLVAVADVESGAECAAGGVRIDSGADDNGNGTLEADEIDASRFVCNGAAGTNGADAVARLSDEPAGSNCPFGGTRIDIGIDTNENETLDSDEVTDTQFSCDLSADAFEGVIYASDINRTNISELFATGLSENAERKLLGSRFASQSVSGATVSPDGTRLASSARIAEEGRRELFVVSLLNGNPPLNASAPITEGGELRGFDWSPDGEKLAYLAEDDGTGVTELYIVNADGTGTIKANPDLPMFRAVSTFDWSPDGSLIAYRSNPNGLGLFELFVVDRNGQNNRKVSGTFSGPGSVSFQRWAPDSSRLAYQADQDTTGLKQLYTVAPDGSGNVRVSRAATIGEDVEQFRWAPDSSRLYYTGNFDGPGTDDLYTVGPDGLGSVRLNEGLGESVFSPSFSPDSSKIVFSAGFGFAGGDRVIVSAVDGSEQVVVSPDATVIDPSVAAVQWSPNSARVAYLAALETEMREDLYVANADGTGRVRLTESAVPFAVSLNFDWTPDSSNLVYRISADGISFEVFVSRLDGNPAIRLNPDLPSGGSAGQPRLTADGSRVVFEADQPGGDEAIYSVQVDGTGLVQISEPAQRVRVIAVP